MKQVEITVRVNNNEHEIKDILENQGFKIIRNSRIEDKYVSQLTDKLNGDNIPYILENCVLIRKIILKDSEVKKITYKQKKYENGNLLYEEKTSVNIDNIENVVKLFSKLGFKNLVDVNYDCFVYSNNKIELAFQNVEGLGMLLEYESAEDFEGKTTEIIYNKKQKMLKEIKSLGLNIENNTDIRKATELIKKSLNNN